jgi:hypothetical protein
MVVRVTCGGILSGTAHFDPPEGVAHAPLSPTRAYVLASPAARSLGSQFASTQFWLPSDGDFADVAAARWDGARLALEDTTGRELAVNSILVLDGLPGAPGESTVRVVADFRSDLARAEARLRSTRGGDGKRTRPAA